MFVGVADARTGSSNARPACFAPLKGNAKIDFADRARVLVRHRELTPALTGVA